MNPKVCDMFNAIHLDYINSDKYRIELKFYNLEDSKSFEIKDYLFTVFIYIFFKIRISSILGYFT